MCSYCIQCKSMEALLLINVNKHILKINFVQTNGDKSYAKLSLLSLIKVSFVLVMFYV